MTVLTALRIFGPISLDALARELHRDIPAYEPTNVNLVGLDWALWGLEKAGLAEAPANSRGTWDITPEGRLLFTAQCAVRRDGARACVGVKI